MIHYCQLSSNSTSHPILSCLDDRNQTKQELQARFQLAMFIIKKALNWLKPLKSTASTTSTSSETPMRIIPLLMIHLWIYKLFLKVQVYRNWTIYKNWGFYKFKRYNKMKQSTTTTASNLTSNR